MKASKRATMLAALAWCDPRTSHIEMDVRLAEVMAELLDAYAREVLERVAKEIETGLTGEITEFQAGKFDVVMMLRRKAQEKDHEPR